MTRYDTGITFTSMYGHYNAYAVYKLKDGRWKVYRHTFTDSPFYDEWNSDKWCIKRKIQEALKLARMDTHPTILDHRPSWNYLAQAFHM